MSIERRQTTRGSVYDVRLRTPDGRQYKRTFRTRSEAETFMAREQADKSRGDWTDPRSAALKFADWAAEWLRSDPSKRPSSLARDESVLRNHLLPPLGERPLGAITPREVQGLVSAWSKRSAPRTVSRQYDVLRAILAAAVQADLIVRSPCRGIRLPAAAALERPVLTPEGLSAVAEAVGPDWEAMVWLGAILGLRWGECAGLRLGRIDFAARKLAVVEQATRARHGVMVLGPPKSEAGRRTMTVPEQLLTLLAAHVERRGLTTADAFLFAEADGDVLDYSNWRSRVWVPACREAGLPGLVFHDLRRANATALVAEGVDLKTAQTRLGHSDPRLTLAIYAQATTEADRSAADRLAGRLMGTPNRSGREQTAAAPDGCAMDVPWTRSEAEGGAKIIPLTRRSSGREGGIRTRDLSVPNAGHGVFPQPGHGAEVQVTA
jgi:integrase